MSAAYEQAKAAFFAALRISPWDTQRLEEKILGQIDSLFKIEKTRLQELAHQSDYLVDIADSLQVTLAKIEEAQEGVRGKQNERIEWGTLEGWKKPLERTLEEIKDAHKVAGKKKEIRAGEHRNTRHLLKEKLRIDIAIPFVEVIIESYRFHAGTLPMRRDYLGAGLLHYLGFAWTRSGGLAVGTSFPTEARQVKAICEAYRQRKKEALKNWSMPAVNTRRDRLNECLTEKQRRFPEELAKFFALHPEYYQCWRLVQPPCPAARAWDNDIIYNILPAEKNKEK